MSNQPDIFTPQQAADYLGIKPAMLRRHAKTYERATGEYLGTGPRGARRFSREVLDNMHAAMQAYRSGAAQSVEEALRSPQTLEEATPGGLSRPADVEALTAAVAARVGVELRDVIRQEIKSVMREALEEHERETKPKRRGLWPWN